MYSSLIITICVLSRVNVSKSVKVHLTSVGVISNIKFEINPIVIPCRLSNIVIIAAPVINRKHVFYELHRPNGEITTLHLSQPHNYEHTSDINTIYFRNNMSVACPIEGYRYLNTNEQQVQDKWNDTVREKTNSMNENEFMVGPLSEDDYGNWVLCLFVQENGEWIEVFQVITMDIREYIPQGVLKWTAQIGSEFIFGFPYPISEIESCECEAPRTTFDRWYGRILTHLDSCLFVIKNVTLEDEGDWKVYGLGRIVYETEIKLVVI